MARHRAVYVVTAGTVAFLELALLLLASFEYSGDPAPLPYVPIFNPFDLLVAGGLALGVWLFRILERTGPGNLNDRANAVVIALGGLAFLLSTLAVVRAVHHFGDVPWSRFTLTRSTAVQAALSIYWAILGVAGMVIGTRREHYWIWLTGVGLMVLVVLKLFFVDLGNTGTVARIVSFMGVGALLLVVGYFAPRPPRPGSAAQDARAPAI